MAYSTVNASDASITPTPAAIPLASDDRRRRTRKDAAQREEEQVAAERADERHVDDIEPECAQPAVGEQQCLHDEHDGHAERTHPWPDEHRREDAAQQVSARAAGDGKVEHLHREDECGDHARQRYLLFVEHLGGAAHAHAQCAGGNDTGAHRGAAVDESVRNMHSALSRFAVALPIRNANRFRM